MIMNRPEVLGISLESLEAPIQHALRSYEELSEGRMAFDAANASRLVATPDKPNSARGDGLALFENEAIGKLFVIAFAPGDGSGDESAHKLIDLAVDPTYPRTQRIVPRDKSAAHSEAHMTILSQQIDSKLREPKLFDGQFDLLGLTSAVSIGRIGTLGRAEYLPQPCTTLTVGYSQGERFGDPHAVYSARPDIVQVCAFLAISPEVHAKKSAALESLEPKLPA
jgi:hypothetical protein